MYAEIYSEADMDRLRWWFQNQPEIAAIIEAAAKLMPDEDEDEA